MKYQKEFCVRVGISFRKILQKRNLKISSKRFKKNPTRNTARNSKSAHIKFVQYNKKIEEF